MSDVHEHPTIAGALVAFQAEMPTVPKNHTVQVRGERGQSYTYTYADLADLSAAAMPLLTKHGLAFTATPRQVTPDTYELAGVLLHVSGETIEGTLPIHGRRAQEIGSSLTYGRRYLLGCLPGIVTDDDDAGQAAHSAPQQQRAPRTDSAPASDIDPRQVALDAIAAAGDVEALRAVYRDHHLVNAPRDVMDAFDTRQAALSGGSA